ncbi:hypothetical protein HAX54_036678 [Datura stramonium]|uniref:Ankyrin repeat protein n=1 Tax=Datura stramonium TaxID=4076 RepID=A0ABS8SGC8_DATST|nr:hypothetical protein [Datura stramonium]
MKTRQEDNIVMIKNFLQHQKKLKGSRLGDLLHRVGEENGDLNMYVNLLTVAITVYEIMFLFLMHQHIAASKGHEECVVVLLIHGCNIHLQAIIAKYHSTFRVLYHLASFSDPYIAGELLCTTARKNDLTIMKELLKHGLQVDSKDRDGSTAIQVALEENLEDMVKLLLMNGAEINDKLKYKLSMMNLSDMLQNEK